MKGINEKIHLIAAGLFFALAAYFAILNIDALCRIQGINPEAFTSFYILNRLFSAFPIAIGYILVGVMLLSKKAKPICSLGFVICFIVNVVSSILYQTIEVKTYNSVGYLIAISRSRVSSPFNTYLGETIALLFMILLIFLIRLAPANISDRVKKIWFISGTVKALFVFWEMKNSFDAMNYFGPRAADVVSYIGWNLYQVVIIVAYLLAGLWFAKKVNDTI